MASDAPQVLRSEMAVARKKSGGKKAAVAAVAAVVAVVVAAGTQAWVMVLVMVLVMEDVEMVTALVASETEDEAVSELQMHTSGAHCLVQHVLASRRQC